MYYNILVAVDLSNDSQKVIDTAVRMAMGMLANCI
ncbi:MAG: hypothetical protein CM1200mP40_24240 [Gammaproteobacteria bacterium]|nr:MAG: hypothetical protein CM1200mP40_24240 [Gammaproteobacteria bacterium]